MKVRLNHEMPWELDGGDRPEAKKFDVTVLPAAACPDLCRRSSHQ